MEKQLIVRLHKNFENCAHEKDRVEFWYARELQTLLGYDKWSNFENVINKAKIACETAKQKVSDHFADAGKTIPMPKGASKEIVDIMLTRYACYLIAQNGDPRKDEIAFAMTYFAVQTRKQEIVEQRLAQLERIHAREKLSISEKTLSGILFERGVDGQGFARIRSKGDQALFGGYNTQEMKNKFSRGVEIVGSAIIENKEGEILLVKSPKWSNKWTMPGGHIEPGESIEHALLREAEEEVGLKMKSQGIVAYGELIDSKDFHRPAHFIYFDILCKTDSVNIKLDNKELFEYVWVKPRKALAMNLAESYEKTIKDYLKFKKQK